MPGAQSASDARLAIQRATAYLVARQNCSVQSAWVLIQQEAMAKRANLDTVAKSIVAGEPILYRYSIPI